MRSRNLVLSNWFEFVDLTGTKPKAASEPSHRYRYAKTFCFVLFTDKLVGAMITEVPDRRTLSMVCQLLFWPEDVCRSHRKTRESSSGLRLNSTPVEDCLQDSGFGELLTNKSNQLQFSDTTREN